jgi:hypothetical protein
VYPNSENNEINEINIISFAKQRNKDFSRRGSTGLDGGGLMEMKKVLRHVEIPVKSVI